MSTTTTAKPSSSSCFSRFPKNKRRLLLILLTAVALLFAATTINGAYKRFTLLHKDMMQAQILFSQFKQQIDNRLNYNEGVRIAQLEQAWRLSEDKLSHQQETIQKLEQALAQKSQHSGIKEVQLLQELKARNEIYFQYQQKLSSYEQHLSALTQEIKSLQEQNQLFKQEQARMRAQYEELMKKSSHQAPQSSQETLGEDLESRLSQFVYADYEHEQKLKDLQKAVESCAKVGELKAIEVYYDDKIDSLSEIIKSSNNGQKKSSSQAVKESEVSQLKQELIKLNIEKEEMKTAVNTLWNQQRKNEEKLNKLVETQNQHFERPTTPLKNTPKNVQKEVNQKAVKKESEDPFHDFYKQFGIPEQVEEQQNHMNRRKMNPSVKQNIHPHFVDNHPRMGHFNYDPLNQFSGFPRSNVFHPRQRHFNHGMMEDFMLW